MMICKKKKKIGQILAADDMWLKSLKAVRHTHNHINWWDYVCGVSPNTCLLFRITDDEMTGKGGSFILENIAQLLHIGSVAEADIAYTQWKYDMPLKCYKIPFSCVLRRQASPGFNYFCFVVSYSK